MARFGLSINPRACMGIRERVSCRGVPLYLSGADSFPPEHSFERDDAVTRGQSVTAVNNVLCQCRGHVTHRRTDLLNRCVLHDRSPTVDSSTALSNGEESKH